MHKVAGEANYSIRAPNNYSNLIICYWSNLGKVDQFACLKSLKWQSLFLVQFIGTSLIVNLMFGIPITGSFLILEEASK